MNLDEKENYSQNNQNFQDDEKQYESNPIDSPKSNHSFTDNAEPDYSEDLANAGQNSEKSGNSEFNNDFDNEDPENEELSYESQGNIDHEDEPYSTDEEGTNRNQ